MAMNMPPDVEARIRALPGNQTCSDCNNIKPQWASVTYGSLVCLECSGQHRSLGVHLSFVRSVQMDSWKPEEIKRMELSGGNAALVEFFSSRGIDKGWPVAAKYSTKQAAYFKERLSRRVQGKTEPPPDPGRYDPVSGGDAQGAEPLPNETPDEYNARQARLREIARERLRQKFGDKGMGGVGSEPMPSSDGIDLGGAIGGLGRMVGGTLGGVGNFLRSNVIENEGLHSTIRGTVGAVGETAGGAWSSIRRSIGEADSVGGLVGGIKHHTLDQTGALRQGLGWTAGAVGGILEKASHGIGDLMDDSSAGQASPTAPCCSKGHPLRADPRSDWTCSLCSTRGTRYCCSQGCRYAICTKCFEKPGGSISQKNSMNFDDDEWGEGWGDAPQKAAPPEPTQADMNKLAQDLGMKLSADRAPSGSPGGEQQRPRSETAPAATMASPTSSQPARSPTQSASGAAAPAAASGGASPTKPKKKGLEETDDFFSEFGL